MENFYGKFRAAIATQKLGILVKPCPPAQCNGMEFTTSKGEIISLCHSQAQQWQVCTSKQIEPLYTGSYNKAWKVWARFNK